MKTIISSIFILGMSPAFSQTAVECFKKANSAFSSGLYLSVDNSIALCAGTVDLEPVVCFTAARSNFSNGPLSVDNAIELCAGTRNASVTMACFKKANTSYAAGTRLSLENSIDLCKTR